MTPDLDGIRRRLEAIEGIDWDTVKREYHAEEYYSKWVHVGPVMMHHVVPEDEITEENRAEAACEKQEQEAVIDFLRHAAEDLRALLNG